MSVDSIVDTEFYPDVALYNRLRWLASPERFFVQRHLDSLTCAMSYLFNLVYVNMSFLTLKLSKSKQKHRCVLWGELWRVEVESLEE